MKSNLPASVVLRTLVAGAVSAHVCAAQVQFPAPRFDLGGGSPTVVGDVDHDGKLDLAAPLGGGFALASGDGLGGFSTAVPYPSNVPFFSTKFVELRDMNSDGRSDVALFGYDTSTAKARVVVYLTTSSGAIGAPVASPLYANGFVATFVELNSDSYVDVVIARGSGDELLTAFGAATGLFSASTSTVVSPLSGVPILLPTDFDGDGDNDLLIQDGTTQSVRELANNGTGTFAPPVIVATGLAIADLHLADIDNDTRADLVYWNAATMQIEWRPRLISGVFAAPVALASPPFSSWQLRTIDLDRDGLLDIVGSRSASGVAIWRATGVATYGAATTHYAGDNGELSWGDVNGDGHTDLIVGGPNSGSSVFATVLFGDGAGLVNSVRRVTALDSSSLKVASDFHLDGFVDLAMASGTQGTFAFMHGGPGGAFGTPISVPAGGGVGGLTAGDIDLDGRPDIVVTGGNEVRVLLATSAGGFLSPMVVSTGGAWWQPTVGDVTGDGLPDVVVCAAPNTFGSYGDRVRVLRGLGTGAFLSPVDYVLSGEVHWPAIADVNGDGLEDVVARRWSGAVGFAVLFGQAGGTLSAPSFVTTPKGEHAFALADFDLDGDVDVVGSRSALGPTPVNVVDVLLNDGLGRFPTTLSSQPLFNPRDVITADLDADGTLEIIAGVSGGYAVIARDGLGGLAAPRLFGSQHDESPATYVAAHDLDGNGRPEILLQESSQLLVSASSPAAPRVGVYCTAKNNSQGCTPSLSFTGNPSASQSSGFVISASEVVNQKNGLFFYGLNGSLVTPFAGGSRCVAMPVRRTPPTSSGGSSLPQNDCSGVMAFDMNAFAAGTFGQPDPLLAVAGTHVHCQLWARDLGLPPTNVQLSNALQYFVEP